MFTHQVNEVVTQLTAARQAIEEYKSVLGEMGLPQSELLASAERNINDAVQEIAGAEVFAETSISMLRDAGKLITTAQKNLERIGLVHE